MHALEKHCDMGSVFKSIDSGRKIRILEERDLVLFTFKTGGFYIHGWLALL
jgi:hypothetical protein